MSVVTTGSMPRETHVPSHPGVFEVHFAPGDFASSLHASRAFRAGERICTLAGWLPQLDRTRTSVQCGENEHLELNTDLVFGNHSCHPNIKIDMSGPDRDAWTAIAIRDIQVGDELTWFYPSAEWDAVGNGFMCLCGSEACIGTFRGAKGLSKDVLCKYACNAHIVRLATRRDRSFPLESNSDVDMMERKVANIVSNVNMPVAA